MSEQLTVQEPLLEQQPVIHPEAQLQNDMTIRDFLALLRENGLDKEVQALNELFDNLNRAEQQFAAMHQKIHTLEDELDRLRGDTPMTDQFKKEMRTRADQMREHVSNLSNRFRTAKDSIIESARQGVRNFVEKGRSALHHACASMYQAGIQYFESSRNLDQKMLDYSKDMLERVNKISESAKDVRQQQSNLVRMMFGHKPKETPDAGEGLVLSTIRRTAEADITSASSNIRDKTKILMKLESHRDRHLEAAKRKPSFDEKLDDAKKRAEFGSKTGMSHDRGQSGPAR